MSLFLFSPLSLLYLTSVSPLSLALFSPLSSPPLILFVVFIHAGGDQGLKYSLSPDSSACARCTIAILASVPWRSGRSGRSSGRSWAWCSGRGAEKKSVKMRKMREMRDRWETNEKDWEGQSESHLEQHMMTHTHNKVRGVPPLTVNIISFSLSFQSTETPYLSHSLSRRSNPRGHPVSTWW